MGVAHTPIERFLDHFMNSSIFIFHQESGIRQWCQRCVINDDDHPIEGKKEKTEQSLAVIDGQSSKVDDSRVGESSA